MHRSSLGHCCTLHTHSAWLFVTFFLLAGMFVWNRSEEAQVRPASDESAFQLDVVDDGKQLKLLVRHQAIGPVCELMCYEGGPFYYGTASKRMDGSVVFVHRSGKMTATTTFAPSAEGRIWMDIVVEGPLEELKQVKFMGPCMQFWHSAGFKRQGSLVEFFQRAFLYTVRGPAGLLDTARGPMKSFKSDAPENNPPYTQWYVPIGRVHPGDIWAFGTSGDRTIEGIVGVSSNDGRWLAAIGCARTRNLGQGWHDCIHHVPDMQTYFDRTGTRLQHRSAIYVMPNNRLKLLEAFHRDFPKERNTAEIQASPAGGGTLEIRPSPKNGAALKLSINVPGESRQRPPEWNVSPWGGFVRRASAWQMWAMPNGNFMEFWISLKPSSGTGRIQAVLNGPGWKPAAHLKDVPAVIQRSSDGEGVVALMWERSEIGDPSEGVTVPGPDPGVMSVRGRLYFYRGDVEALRERWVQSNEEWKNSVPYRMPIEGVATSARIGGVRFAPNREEEMTYGLTIIPPWKEAGTLHVNFPEHFEHGDVGYGILRYSDKRSNPWRIAPDGHSASYEVESPELPGVMVQASAVAQGDRAYLSLKLVNGGKTRLERIKPLLCFWYSKLVGFPQKLSQNFENTYVIQAGRLSSLRSMATANPQATAKVAYVKGCSQHDCDKFAKGRGGLIERDIDKALIAVTDTSGARKIVIAFTPGKSILSNAVIPCAHADPYLGALAPGESVEASGVVVFDEAPLDQAVASLQ